jgi:hypothetical protein
MTKMCALCGSMALVELRETEMLQKQIEALYIPGPFIFNCVLHCQSEIQLCCSHCLNHIRKRKNRKRKCMLPMDQYLLGLLHYKFMDSLDQRSIKRLQKNLKSNTTFYNLSRYYPLHFMLNAKDVCRTWRTLNLSTNFFSHYAIAKHMRYKNTDSNLPC